jgi:hypothetical protein
LRDLWRSDEGLFRPVKLVGERLAKRWKQVSVSVEGYGDAGVTETFLQFLRMSAGGDRERSCRVPHIVDAQTVEGCRA